MKESGIRENKIGILTASRTDNNGTDLQAYAMQHIFEMRGCRPELIDYRCPKLENSRRILRPFGIKKLLSAPVKLYDRFSHEIFRKKHFRYSERSFRAGELSKLDHKKIVVGSDQIWNLDLTGGDTGFYLEGANKGIEKYSYAASIGRTDVTDWEERFGICSLLKDFRRVSVREQSAVNALESIGVSARYDLDPILMLGSDEWRKLAVKSRAKKPYILVYTVGGIKRAVDSVRSFAESRGLEIIVLGNPLKPLKGVNVMRFIGIPRWLGLVSGAELVATDSYHGLAFTILFEKPFLRIGLDNAQSNSRLTDLISALGITENGAGEPTFPDYGMVNERLAELSAASFDYIGTITGAG